jgi:UDP-N-acetylmuramoyl-tripeptide--D-alanyl-D-alanine ligase
LNYNNDKKLWSSKEVSKILGVNTESDWYCNNVEIDSRKVKSGSLFLAMPGTKLDGHSFLKDAVKKGAVGLVVKKSYKSSLYNNKLIKVNDVLQSLIIMSKAARKRINNSANIIAITGSSGKTSTKEMMSSAFGALGKIYANPDSYNNHVGVPYSLVNMSKDCQSGIFEIGMNNTNEISKLSKLVKPNIAIVTNISEAHIGNFNSIHEVIKAKSEILNGLQGNGYLIINRDFKYYDKFITYTNKFNNINIVTYGANKKADIYLSKRVIKKKGQKISASAYGKNYDYKINFDGIHQAVNSLAILASLLVLKCNVSKGLKNLSKSFLPQGRGNKYNLVINGYKSVLIDDSYNANPSSVIASLSVLNEIAKNNRKVLILGEMGELGKYSANLHKKLFEYINKFNIGLVIFVGNNTKDLFKISKIKIQAIWSESVDKIIKEDIINLIKPKDYILVKGSRFMRMEQIVKFIRNKYTVKVDK